MSCSYNCPVTPFVTDFDKLVELSVYEGKLTTPLPPLLHPSFLHLSFHYPFFSSPSLLSSLVSLFVRLFLQTFILPSIFALHSHEISDEERKSTDFLVRPNVETKQIAESNFRDSVTAISEISENIFVYLAEGGPIGFLELEKTGVLVPLKQISFKPSPVPRVVAKEEFFVGPNGNILFLFPEYIGVIDFSTRKWDSLPKWIFLGREDRGSVFWNFPKEILFNMLSLGVTSLGSLLK